MTLTPSNGGKTWTISCTVGGPLDRTGSMPKGYFSDGIYQLTLHGSAITDAATSTNQYNGGPTRSPNLPTGRACSKMPSPCFLET